ncbi:MAG TPA: glutamate--tRNA ligase [Acidiferrobacteraceae bacterium]|nr:glutamate--tRNA ligase [Acidiferrobacteraceae bacterium]
MAELLVKTRFAPSPTGYLHLGNARTALFSALWARALGGQFVLRIEDTDAARSRPEYTDALVEDLHWLGLTWDEGPGAASGADASRYFQSRRQDLYDELLEQLLKQGQAYECYCAPEALLAERAAQRAAGRPPRYSGRCRTLGDAERRQLRAQSAPSLRFAVAESATIRFDDAVRGPQQYAAADIGDFVIRRSDGTAAFFFSNAVDDALMGITHVLRGEDHLANTPRQLMLLDALHLARPQYAHVGLISGALANAPLSKRDGAVSLREFRQQGWRPEALLNYMGRLGSSGAGPELETLAGLSRSFAVASLSRGPARHDAQQLEHWQHLAVQQLDVGALQAWAGAALAEVPEMARSAFVAAVRRNVVLPADVQHWARQIYGTLHYSDAAMQAIQAAGSAFFCAAAEIFADAQAAPETAWRALGTATSTRGKSLFAPLRAALTGQLDGPELAQIVPLISPEQRVQRLQRFCEMNS